MVLKGGKLLKQSESVIGQIITFTIGLVQFLDNQVIFHLPS